MLRSCKPARLSQWQPAARQSFRRQPHRATNDCAAGLKHTAATAQVLDDPTQVRGVGTCDPKSCVEGPCQYGCFKYCIHALHGALKFGHSRARLQPDINESLQGTTERCRCNLDRKFRNDIVFDQPLNPLGRRIRAQIDQITQVSKTNSTVLRKSTEDSSVTFVYHPTPPEFPAAKMPVNGIFTQLLHI
jgi:hypothetical protein